MRDELKYNGSGYHDPTAYKAIKRISEEDIKVSKVIKTIQAVAHVAGFEIVDRIVLRDKETGKEWR